MEFPGARLLVFAKAPDLGAVKSRLIPSMGEERATELYVRMARRCIQIVCDSQLCPVELWCSPSIKHPFFLQCEQEFPLQLREQCGEDLGQRMAHALTATLENADFAAVIGTDCPSITASDLRRCLHWLDNETDVVIGPAEDSGYYLLGLRKIIETLFDDIPWGGPQVLPLTRHRLNQQGIGYRELAMRWDVDQPEDVDRLQREELLTDF